MANHGQPFLATHMVTLPEPLLCHVLCLRHLNPPPQMSGQYPNKWAFPRPPKDGSNKCTMGKGKTCPNKWAPPGPEKNDASK